MAALNSRMMPLGTSAPYFSLPDPEGNHHSLPDAGSCPATVVMFICNHCPFVKHMQSVLAEVTAAYIDQDVAVYAINSNDAEAYPGDSPEKMMQDVAAFDYRFPYLIDEDQSVAKAYEAACTPDFFLFDKDLKLAYRGQFDGSRPGNSLPVTGEDLTGALDAVLKGNSVSEKQIPSIGCNIKWKPGSEPEWFLNG